MIIFQYIFWFLVFLLSLLIDSLLFFLPYRRQTIFFITKITAKIMLFGLRIKVNIIEHHPISLKSKFLLISNHQSLMDIVLLYSFVNYPFSFIAKKELFYIPFLGWYLIVTNALSMNRKKLKQAHRDIQKAILALKKGHSFLIFPEGTRTIEDAVHAFKRGFLRMAKEADVDLLPVIMRGSQNILKKGSFKLNPNQRVDVIIGEPIAIRHLSDVEALKLIEDYFQSSYRKLKLLDK